MNTRPSSTLHCRAATMKRAKEIIPAVTLWAAAIVTASCQLPSLRGEVLTDKRPAWASDLRKMGFIVNDFAPPEVVEATRQIAFGTADELVVVSSRASFAKPDVVRAFLLEAKSGAVVSTEKWTAKGLPYVFATADGRYAAVTETGLVAYSAGLKEVLATAGQSARMASPDGRSLAAWKSVPGHGVTSFIDAKSLRPTGVEYLDTNVLSISQNQIAYTAYASGSPNPAVHVRGPTGSASVYRTECSEVQPNFISENVLAVLGCDQVDVITSEGERLFSHATEGDSTFAGASRDGSRFAIVEAFYGSGHDPKLRAERFIVFDVRTRKPVFTTDIVELRGRERGRSGAALSPDGSALAVNSLGIVRLFHIGLR